MFHSAVCLQDLVFSLSVKSAKVMQAAMEILRSTLIRRILVRAVGYTIHGLIPASCVFADRYNRSNIPWWQEEKLGTYLTTDVFAKLQFLA